MALTGKKKLFADAKLRGLTNKEAAVAAGYSEATAAQAGSRLAKDKDVIAALERTGEAKDTKESPQYQEALAQVIQAQAEGKPSSIDIGKIVLTSDPLAYMMGVMNDPEADPKLRLEASKALAAFTIAKPGEKGKKEQQQDAAKQSNAGRFGLRAVK